MKCMDFLPCFKKKQKAPTFITIHIIKEAKREDDEIEGKDIGVEDDILKKMKTIKNSMILNILQFVNKKQWKVMLSLFNIFYPLGLNTYAMLLFKNTR